MGVVLSLAIAALVPQVTQQGAVKTRQGKMIFCRQGISESEVE